MQNQQIILTLPGRSPAILDSELARLFGTETNLINKARNRNPERFPQDFAFQLTNQEFKDLRFQSGTAVDRALNMVRSNPWAYTEEGVAMISGILTTPQAVAASVRTLRLFRELRHDVLPALTANVETLKRELFIARPEWAGMADLANRGLTVRQIGKLHDKSPDAARHILNRIAACGLVERTVNPLLSAAGKKGIAAKSLPHHPQP